MLTKEQFIEKSRGNSERVTEKLLALGAAPTPCDCDYSGCEGWSWQPLSGLPGLEANMNTKRAGEDFNKRFEKRFEDFDQNFARMRRWGVVGAIFTIVIGLGAMGFFIWVVVMLLRFWGVV